MSGTPARQERDLPSLTDCDREPIHLLGHVQQFGCLLALSSDWIVRHVSANVRDFLGLGVDELVGKPLAPLVDEEVIESLRAELRMLHDDDGVARLYARRLKEDGPLLNFAVHGAGSFVILEIERAGRGEKVGTSMRVQSMIAELAGADDLQGALELSVRHVQQLTGFDRVMIYQFAPDGSGRVAAEAKRHDQESFLELRYPRSDIPEQARELYKRNLLRIISNVDEEPVPILPMEGPSGDPLDLSLAKLRSVSPIHIEYLQNMGVSASLSISLMQHRDLWGLIACHHDSPRVLDLECRAAAELYGHLFSYVIERRMEDERRRQEEKARQLHDRLMARIADGDRIDQNFEMIANAFRSVIDLDGIGLFVDGSYQQSGCTPTEDEFREIGSFLNRAAASRVFATDRLTEVFPAAADFSVPIAGLLAIPVSRQPRDFLVCFRKEVAQTVDWAGDPRKSVTKVKEGTRLSPRQSFSKWTEVVQGRSKPWTEAEMRAADALRVTLLEVVIRLTDKAARQAARASERQELLIAELNHRVRNILNLIRGLIAQSQADEDDIESFTNKIGGRIHALARAHDQITREQWLPASLREMIATEKEAFLNEKADRVLYFGDDVLLAPEAFTALSLVFHELLTNSQKYGALTDHHGRVEITAAYEDGRLDLQWREFGGPAVKKPKRRGFGTTIIERSVPFELGGESELRFEPDGVVATFSVPEEHVAGRNEKERSPDAEKGGRGRLSGTCLVVEDNMIIAMDTEDMLTRLGAEKVVIAANVKQAMKLIEKETITFALLDVNLGSETSEPVAEEIDMKGIPFAFSTGYGDAHGLVDRFPDAGVLQKPVDENALSQTVKTLVGS
ncbi:two-component system sensor histidine kinase/response regulator [Pacificimonas flava]|uniref:histidine kinase n=2 Tax=Pacificimonas TaxID=1960290 RepID=A0A219B103_9SPHN|nr:MULTISPECIES: HWE histidine kinase domain-containing protein [Pacificimonas]MBZ6380040.1 GAF domain-containing protein [Pacificimonas aurantium]OWV32011.1 two-component system sensor histidine kinase/response regulator [Pacificimonas flava]